MPDPPKFTSPGVFINESPLRPPPISFVPPVRPVAQTYVEKVQAAIQQGLAWVAFEPNNEKLWAAVCTTVSNFLYGEWRNGSLLGAKPEEAFFVRCDRTTMTQNDIDNGRLICLVGIAPVVPAEFVVIRISQMTSGGTNA
jgi:uncharacterized protein